MHNKQHIIIDLTPMQFVRRAGSTQLGWKRWKKT